MECHHFPESDWVLVYLWEVVHHSFCWWWALCVCVCMCMYVFLSSSSFLHLLNHCYLHPPVFLLLLFCLTVPVGKEGTVGKWLSGA